LEIFANNVFERIIKFDLQLVTHRNLLWKIAKIKKALRKWYEIKTDDPIIFYLLINFL
jgi:hypothetical protein